MQTSNPVGIQPTQPISTKKTPWFLMIPIILLASTTGIFAYKYYQLRQQLSNQQPTPTPVIASPFLSSPQSVVDTNDDLKEYINNEHRFGFNYPQEMIIRNSSVASVSYIETPSFNISDKSAYQIQITVINDNPPIPSEYMIIPSNIPEYDFLENQVEEYLGGASVVTRTYKDGWEIYKKYYFYTGGLGISLKGTGYDHSILDQTASTFKFL